MGFCLVFLGGQRSILGFCLVFDFGFVGLVCWVFCCYERGSLEAELTSPLRH